VINSIQSISGATIRLSQSRDYFPGTHDRTVLIYGALNSVKHAQCLILEGCRQHDLASKDTHVQMQEKSTSIQEINPDRPLSTPYLQQTGPFISQSYPGTLSQNKHDVNKNAIDEEINSTNKYDDDDDGTAENSDNRNNNVGVRIEEEEKSQCDYRDMTSVELNPSREQCIRVVVPFTAAGIIIGKKAANLKHIKGSSLVKNIRVCDKSDCIVPNERIVCIYGNIECCSKAICQILDLMSNYKEQSSYLNMTTSYSRMKASLNNPQHYQNHPYHHHHLTPQSRRSSSPYNDSSDSSAYQYVNRGGGHPPPRDIPTMQQQYMSQGGAPSMNTLPTRSELLPTPPAMTPIPFSAPMYSLYVSSQTYHQPLQQQQPIHNLSHHGSAPSGDNVIYYNSTTRQVPSSGTSLPYCHINDR